MTEELDKHILELFNDLKINTRLPKISCRSIAETLALLGYSRTPKPEMTVELIELITDYLKDVESGIKYLEISKQDYGYGKERLRNKAQVIHTAMREKGKNAPID